MRWKVTTAPTTEPISLADAKTFLRVEHTADDSLITAQIAEARVWCEEYTRRSLITQTLTGKLDGWPESTFRNPNQAIYLPRGNTQQVVSITYLDEDSNAQVLAGPTSTPPGTGFQEDLTDPFRAVIWPEYDEEWPDIDASLGCITVVWVSGYGAAGSNVPQELLSAIKYRLAGLYMLRGPADLATRALAGTWETGAERMAGRYRIDNF